MDKVIKNITPLTYKFIGNESPYKAWPPLARYLHGASTFLNWNAYNMNDEIKHLTNLKFLCVNNNHHITDINSLTNLVILYACGDSGLSNNGIEKLTKLKELYIDKNLKINIFDHFKCLTKLSIHGHDYETFDKYYETIDHIYVNDEHCSRYFKEKKLK